jgi:hypothetical protein
VKARFQADADLRHAIVTGLVRRSADVDFRSATDALIEGFSDPAVLAFAAQDNRVLISHDVTTMLSHFREFVGQHRSPGLVLIPQKTPIARAIDDLLLLWEVLDADEIVNRAIYIPGLSFIL